MGRYVLFYRKLRFCRVRKKFKNNTSLSLLLMRHYLMYRECKISEITKSSEKLRGFFMHKSQTFLSLGFVITQRSLFRY